MTPATMQCDILVVEDDDAIRFILAEALQDDGYHVTTAEHGKAALDYLHHATVPPRLILLDLMMPVMNGWDFRAAQRQDPTLRTIPVVVLSAITSQLDLQQRVSLDAAFVPKQINWAQLEQAIATICPSVE